MTDIKIIVATHKEYRMPEDVMYIPVQVGSAINPPLPYIKDKTGDNISIKNPNYCELTGLYWAWKNLDADYLGICHYRRYFRGRNSGDKWGSIIKKEQMEEALKKASVILPKKRNYYIETNYSQYAHAHHATDLDTARVILAEKYPEYVTAFDDSMKMTRGHRFNMLVMDKNNLDKYCTWLFDVLSELEKRLDISQYSPYDRRVFGFVSERLLDVWIDTNRVPYTELPVVNIESQHWGKKIISFITRKIKGSNS